MSEDQIDACPFCGTLIESGERVCPNCEESLNDVDMDLY